MRQVVFTCSSLLFLALAARVAEADQVVWVDFDSATDIGVDPTDFLYTPLHRTTILGELGVKFSGLGVSFTDTEPVSGLYSKVTMNFGGGGDSDGIDFQNKKKGDTARVHAPALLAFVGEPSPTVPEVLVTSVNTIAHEVGHLLGARHDDAYMEVGEGVAPHAWRSKEAPRPPSPAWRTGAFRFLDMLLT